MEDYDGWAPSRSFETEWTLGHLEMDYTKTLVEDPPCQGKWTTPDLPKTCFAPAVLRHGACMGLMRRDGCRWRVQRVLVAMILTLADVPWRLTIDEIHGSKIRVSTNLRPKKLGLGLGDVLLMVLTFFWVGIYI